MRSLLLTLLFVPAAFAQVSTGSIFGQVLDESASAVAGVRITALQSDTNFSRSAMTGGDGAYRLDGLLPGAYSVTADRDGFRTLTASRVMLEINQQARLDLSLKVGTARDSVNVTASVSPLQTSDSSAGYRLDSAMFTALPLDQRNVMALVTLGPGAIPRQLGGFTHDLDNDAQQGTRGSIALNPPINGARASSNVDLLDGGYNTDRNTFAIVIDPPMESVQEFRIQTSLASAEFSQAGGGVIDVVTKSGGREFHGSAFEFFRNEATDARNYFDDPTLPRPIFRRNQFGGSLGGPLGLPSTFFFVTYEGLRGKNAKPSPQIVPDAALRGGNFTGGNPLFDPLSLDPLTRRRAPFPDNVIPASRIDPIAAKYLQQFEPLPNIAANPSGNYIDTTPSTSHDDTVSGRIDHQFHAAGLLFGRYTINNDAGGIGGNFPLRPTSEDLRAQQVVLGHTIGGANWSNEIRAGFTRLRLFDLPLSAFHANVAAALGILNPPSDSFAFGLPYFQISDFSTVTDDPTLPQTQRDNTWSLSDSVSIVRGRHTWKAGVDWVHFQLNYQQSNSIRGTYQYTGAFTGDGTNPGSGDGFADFLLGYPQNTQRTVGSPLAYLRQSSYAAFVQHDWQATARLTLNFGVRYEYAAPFTEARNRLLNLDYSTLPRDPLLVPVHSGSDPDRTDFAPRVGLAWRIPGLFSRGGETVFRAGYGIYFVPEIAAESYDLVLNGVHTDINETSGAASPVLTTRDGFPSNSSAGFPSYFGLDQHAAMPYLQQWNGGFQREMPFGIVLDASYIGSKGTHLGLYRRFNTPAHVELGQNLPPRPGDLQSLRSFPDLGTIFQRQHIANSSYNSLQLKAEKRLRKSLSFLASFVWAKSIDDADNILTGSYDGAGAQDERNLRLERGLSFFDVRRRVSAGFVYNFPRSSFLPAVLNGWQLSGIITIQDGTPVNPLYFATDFANSGTLNRPNVVPGQRISLPESQRTPEHWFNTAAFSDPAPYTFGDAGRDIIPGPGNEVIDTALHRRFAVSERAALEFRAETFNLLNDPNFGIPGPYPDFGPFFGKIFSSGDPRRFQFAARLDF